MKIAAGIICGNKLRIIETLSYPNIPIEKDGHVYVDIDGIVISVKNSIRYFSSRGFTIDTLAFDTFGNCYTYLNIIDGSYIPMYFYKDQRTLGILKEMEKVVPMRELYRMSGVFPTDIRVLMQLFYDAKHGNMPLGHDYRFMMLSDLLVYLFTGVVQAEESIESVAGLLEGDNYNWNYALFDSLGFNTELFPVVVPGGQSAYPVLSNIINECSCHSFKVCCVTAHDTESALLSASKADNSVFASIGTSVIFGTKTNKAIINEISYTNGYKNMKGPFSVSLCRDYNAMWILEQCLIQWKSDYPTINYEILNNLCSKAKENHSFFDVCDTRFRTNGINIQNEIQLFCKETRQPVPETIGELANCIFDSIVLQALASFESIKKILPDRHFDKLICIGGGIKNKRLMQLFSDALNLPVKTGSSVASIIGNLLMQGYSQNILQSEDDIIATADSAVDIYMYYPNVTNTKWTSALNILNN